MKSRLMAVIVILTVLGGLLFSSAEPAKANAQAFHAVCSNGQETISNPDAVPQFQAAYGADAPNHWGTEHCAALGMGLNRAWLGDSNGGGNSQPAVGSSGGQAGACSGSWVQIPTVGIYVGLEVASWDTWGPHSPPRIVSETIGGANIIIMGHNFFRPRWFGPLPQTRIGDIVKVCVQGTLYQGPAVRSQAVDSGATWITGTDWLGGRSAVTVFTSYPIIDGQVDTPQRWVVAFYR